MRISVAMATYNGEPYIKEQLQSILSQLGDSDEVIVSDDGSTDATCDIVNAIAQNDIRVKLVDGPRAGLIRNFEHALSCCSGEYIFLSDQDDIWREGKVETVLWNFVMGADLVLHDAQLIDDKKHLLTSSFFSWRGTRTGYYANIIKNSYIGCCMAFKRSLLRYALPFPEEIPMHDQWIGLLAEKFGKVQLEEAVLLEYRRHEGTATVDHHGSVPAMLHNRLAMMKAIRGRVRSVRKRGVKNG